jgi:hypothetical protein
LWRWVKLIWTVGIAVVLTAIGTVVFLHRFWGI